MTLATRCPACGTVFRVVQDQLRVSEGWVRCGRCSEVFNAVEHMVELPAPRPAPNEAPDASAAPAAAFTPTAVDDDVEMPREALRADDDHDAWSRDDAAPEAPEAPDSRARTAAAPGDDAGLHITLDDDDRRAVPAAGPAPPLASEPEAEPEPSFLREHPRTSRWSRPVERRVLWSLSGLLALLLCVQVGLEYRNLLAARWPVLSPVLEALCSVRGCRIDPPRWIEALVVDSSGLVRVEGTQTYRFSAVLRNRATLPLSMPALDLTLTDTKGAVISRRVLTAADVGVTAAAVPPLAEVPLQAALAVPLPPGTAVAGYTIEFFYP